MSILGSFKNLGLRGKFVFVVSIAIIFSMVIISGYLIKRQNEIYRHELAHRGSALVANLAFNAEYGVILESEEELENLLKGFARAEDVSYALISTLDGRILAEAGQYMYANFVDSIIDKDKSAENKKLAQHYYTASNGDEFLELRYPVQTKKQEHSRENLGSVMGYQPQETENNMETIGYVWVGLSLANLQLEISRSQSAAILLTIMVVFSAIVVMNAFVRIIIRPIESLVKITDQISKGDLNKTVEITRTDEIGLLANSFNRMIDSLKQSKDEIEEYNRTLEEKIIERTGELEDAQQQLVQSEKLAGIGQLAAGVAHELNNPLGGILGYAQFTLEKMEKKDVASLNEKDYASFKRYIKDIETQSRRCKAIVQNLLRFSRSSNKIEFQDSDINQIVIETLTFVEHQFVMKQVKLSKDLDSAMPLIQGNSGQLQQVFTNMLMNGLHASEPGTEMSVSSKFLPPLGEFPGTVEINFSDQGSGINEQDMKKIFEPFFTTKEIGQGTGLGLSVSYGIIKDHNGEIKVKSSPEKGTTFTVMIPLENKSTLADKEAKDI